MELSSVQAIVCALNKANVRYLIVGGLAVTAHGFLRATRDIDLVIQLNQINITCALESLESIGYQLAIPVSIKDFSNAKTRQQWREQKNMIVLKLWSDHHRRTPIDIFVYEPFNFDEEFQKHQPLEIADGVFAPIISLTSLLDMKRTAGRPQDLVDIRELLRAR